VDRRRAAHQCGDTVAMIQHVLAHHFGGMRRQHRRDGGSVQHVGDFPGAYALRAQKKLQGRRSVLSSSGAPWRSSQGWPAWKTT